MDTTRNINRSPDGTDPLLHEVLRLAPEPCTYFTEREVHAMLTRHPVGYMSWVRQHIADIAAGQAQLELPPKQVFHDPGSAADFRVMPCVVRAASGTCKTVKVIGTNMLQQQVPGQITVGKALALHPQENFVSHIFEACLLSSARTGVCAALAIELLAPVCNKLTVIGAGRVGYYAAFYAASLGLIHSLTITDRDATRATATAMLLARQFPCLAVRAVAMHELQETDVVILATTSTEALCHPPAWGANLLVSLGADTDHQRELAPEWASLADIHVDTQDSARFGDLAAWRISGLIPEQRHTDIFDLMRHAAPATARPRLFISTGSALFDNLTISYILYSAAHG